MITKSEPKVAPSQIMQIIKSIAARNFFALYPDIKRKYFWGVNYGLKAFL
jgi:putative transposase